MNLKNKKITLTLLLISIVTIMFFSILQEKKRVYSYDEYGREVYIKQRVVEFLDMQFSFNNSLFFLFLALIIFVISLIFISDSQIIIVFNKVRKKISSVNLSVIWNYISKKTLIISISIISILLLIGKCKNSKNDSSNVNTQEEIDTIPVIDTISVIDSTATSSSAKNNESIDSTNTENIIDPFISKESLLAEAAETQIGKSLKGTSLEFEGDIATQGVDTDQIMGVGGEGAQSINAAYLESAKNIPSKKKK